MTDGGGLKHRDWDEHEGDQDKAGQVYSLIRETLLFHRMPPGTQLNIRNLAREMAVSPTPIREALIRLADEEIITLSPGRGFFTKPLLTRELAADYEMAFMIAKFGIEKNCAGFSLAGLRRPEGFGSEPADLPITNELTRSYAIFLEGLYERIADLTNNSKLVRLMQQFNDRTTHVRELDLQQPHRFRVISEAMAELIELLLNNNPKGAIRNLQAQIDGRFALLNELVKEGNARALGAFDRGE